VSPPVRLVVVPVTVGPLGEGTTAELLGYMPGGQWLADLADRAPLEETLARVLEGAEPAAMRSLRGWTPAPESVGFRATDDGVDLVFTCALPVTAPLLDPQQERHSRSRGEWVRLLPRFPPRPKSGSTEDWQRGVSEVVLAADPVSLAVLDHWRQRIEETTAAFELLPRYFTTPQVRSVYEAVWGEQQDPGNFHKWLHQPNENGGICIEVPAEKVRRAVDEAASRVWRETDGSDAPVAAALALRGLASAATPGKAADVGTSPIALASLAMLSPTLSAVAGVVGGAIAYQSSRKPGRQPVWYSRAGDTRTVLPSLYSPRPPWLVGGMRPLSIDA
jgi:hypothetical protein